MLIKVDLENGFEGKSIAWVQGQPGCFAYGKDGSEAIIRVPPVLLAYRNWIGEHTTESWLEDLGDFDIRLAEAMDWNDPKKPVSNWFQSDKQPLSQTDVERGNKLIAWSRNDLLELVNPLSTEALDRSFEGERWSIRGILKHIAGAEWWYIDRLGLTSLKREDLAGDVFERLAQVRTNVEKVLPDLIENVEVREVEGELWTGRKILRRLAWHEKDHIQHILRLLTL